MSFVRSDSGSTLPMRSALVVTSALVLIACGGDDDDAGPEPLFPADYATTYVEVRDCRASTEHDFANVRVLADPAGLGPYVDRGSPFPEGSVILKEEYDLGDVDCSRDVQGWTVMSRLAEGSAAEALDWHWQRVDIDRNVQTDDEPRCYGCHTDCGVPPDGYLGTCTVP